MHNRVSEGVGTLADTLFVNLSSKTVSPIYGILWRRFFHEHCSIKFLTNSLKHTFIMITNAYASPCARIAPEDLTRLFDLSDLTLPFWGYRKAMPMQNIVRLEGEGNYTLFHFADGTRLMVSLTLKKMESRLDPKVFARPHKKNIVNMLYLEGMHRQQHTVDLANGDRIEVSRRKATHFFRQVEGFQQKLRQLMN
jgi:two-component system, LytTR family, response regulator